MGGAQAHEYMAPSAAGEDRVAVCTACGYAANVELARSVAAQPARRPPARRRGDGAPRGGRHARAAHHRRGLGVPRAWSRWQLIKSLVYMAGDKPVVALVRGDHDLHENKLARYLKAEVRPAHPEEVLEHVGAEVGFVGPVGLAERGLRIVADETLRPDGAGGPARVRGGRQQAAHPPAGSGPRPGLPRPSAPTCARRRPATAAPTAARRSPSTWSSRWATSSSWAPSTPSR